MRTIVKTKLSTKQKVGVAVAGVAIAAALVAAGLSNLSIRNGNGMPKSVPKLVTPSTKLVPGTKLVPPRSLPKMIQPKIDKNQVPKSIQK